MVRRVLTYGDSNTHGTMPIVTPGESRRFGRDIRWPQVMAGALGPAWDLVEEGLPGRTTQFGDPVMGAHMDGRDGLKIALASHAPVDLLTVMLGTNDLKHRFAPSAARIAAGLAGLLDIALHRDMAARHPGMQVLLICPPAVREVPPFSADFLGAEAHAAELPAAVAALAEARGLGFFDAGRVIEVSATDGVHFEAEAHRRLGAALADAVREMA